MAGSKDGFHLNRKLQKLGHRGNRTDDRCVKAAQTLCFALHGKLSYLSRCMGCLYMSQFTKASDGSSAPRLPTTGLAL